MTILDFFCYGLNFKDSKLCDILCELYIGEGAKICQIHEIQFR